MEHKNELRLTNSTYMNNLDVDTVEKHKYNANSKNLSEITDILLKTIILR